MKEVFLGVMIGLGATACCIVGYQTCLTDHVGLKELRDSGYEVVRHSETHGSFHTNWLEVVRRDGRPM